MKKSLADTEPRQSKNCRHNQYNPLDLRSSYADRASRVIVVTAAVLLVVASAGFGCLFAWQTGSRHDVALGGLSVAMALGLEGAKPFAVAGAFASARQLRVFSAAALLLVGLLAIAFSLQAEISFMSATRGDMVAERAGEADTAKRADERYKRAVAALGALKPGGTSRSATAAYLAQREALQSELSAAEQDRRHAPSAIIADPGAVALSTYAAALGWEWDADALGRWLPAIGVLALEAGAALSVILVRSVNPSVAAQQTARPVAQVAHAQNTADVAASPSAAEAAQKPSNSIKVRKRRDDDDDGAGPPSGGKRGVAALLDHVRRNGGAVELGQRELARRLGASRTTLQRALADLAASGVVIVNATRSGTRVALA